MRHRGNKQSIRVQSTWYLAAALGTVGISFLTLPLTTRILGPAAYGRLALVGAVIGMGSSFATLGSSFMINRFIPSATADERAALVSTLCVAAAVVTSAWTVLISVLYILAGNTGLFSEIPIAGFILSVGAMLLAPFWLIASDLLTVGRRASFYTVSVLAQTVVTAIATIASLYVFDLGFLSLFIGLFANNLTSFITALLAMRASLTSALTKHWFGELRRMALFQTFATLSEQGFSFLERVLLAKYIAIGTLGLYAHSQRYREVAQIGVKSISRGSWAQTLQESREQGDFEVTRQTWSTVHLLIALLGITFACFGDHFISIITHGKFTMAYAMAVPWFIYVLIQNTGKAQLGTLIALGEGRTVARINLTSHLCGIAALLIFVPRFGVAGAIAASIGVQTAYRVIVRVVTSRRWNPPLLDGWALLGVVMIFATFIIKRVGDFGIWGSSILFVVSGSILVMLGWRVFSSMSRIVLRRV